MRGLTLLDKKGVINRLLAMALIISMSAAGLTGCAFGKDGQLIQASGKKQESEISTEETKALEETTSEKETIIENEVGTEKETVAKEEYEASEVTESSSSEVVEEETAVTEESAGETTATEEAAAESTAVVQSSGGYSSPFVGVYSYTTPENIDDNIFMDSLIYTGYNIEKHIADGMMWEYLLAAKKRDRGWLSNITYNGGSTGYETTEEGLPDISFFERNGLVCASYVTYVYFNYLPNVVGIDTSELTKPEKSYNANDWYIAAKDWVEQGLSETISFDAALKGGFIKFDPAEEIPIGSILAFCDSRNKSDYCSHVVIYAGYKNGYHWVYHVGNENGPEFCSVERMHFGPDPQWPIAIITPPDVVLEHME